MSRQDFSQLDAASDSPARRLAELTILYEVSHALQRTLDEAKALHIILVGVTAKSGLGFNRALILLLDQEREALRGRLAVGPETPNEAHAIWEKKQTEPGTLRELLDTILNADITRDPGINDRVSRIYLPLSGDSALLANILKSHEACRAVNGVLMPHGLPIGRDLIGLIGAHEFAVAPLFLADKDLGLLIADNALTRIPIDTDDLRMLEIFAQEASAAIENTRLYRRLKDQNQISESRNVTLRESQQQLLHVERISAMGRLATLLAYRIRAPLASIGGFARRLLRSMPPEDSRREEMGFVVEDVTCLERLVAEVLAYRKISGPEFKPADVNALIRSVLITMQDEIDGAGIRTELQLKPDAQIVWIDELQVRQALMNLISNALEAMPAGGIMSVIASSDHEYCTIEVRDSGVGIPKQNWNKLFKPFFTTKTTGTGLGLAVVSQVAENHRGVLTFKSLPGEGTSFYLQLAVDARHEMEPPGGAPAA